MDIQLQGKSSEPNFKVRLIAEEADIKPLEEVLFNRNKRYFSVPGFRKGRAPLGLVKAHYGKDLFADDIADILAHDALDSLAKEGVRNLVFEEDTQLEDITFDLKDDGTLEIVFTAPNNIRFMPSTKALTFEPEEVDFTVSEEEIDNELKAQREENKTERKIEGVIEEGDRVIYDLTAFYDKEDHTEIVANDKNLENTVITDGTFSEWIGKTVPFDETLKTDEDESALVNRYQVKKIVRPVELEIDDDFPNKIISSKEGGFESLEEYKELLKMILGREKRIYKSRKLALRFIKQIIDDSELEADDEMLELRRENLNSLQSVLYEYFLDSGIVEEEGTEQDFIDFLKFLEVMEIFASAIDESQMDEVTYRTIEKVNQLLTANGFYYYDVEPDQIQKLAQELAQYDFIYDNLAEAAINSEQKGATVIETPFLHRREDS